MSNLTPAGIVAELDRYIIGQAAAKRAVAIALRNRYRRKRLGESLRNEVIPKNILMIGPTGVGKTEIARRLAKLASAPFIKVEATKFTEVGYVGRDVDSMIRDLAQAALALVEQEKTQEVQASARAAAEERILDILHPPVKQGAIQANLFGGAAPEDDDRYQKRLEQSERVRARLREQLSQKVLEEKIIEVEIDEERSASATILGGAGISGLDEIGEQISEMLQNRFRGRSRTQKMSIREAREVLAQQEARRLIDPDTLKQEAVERAEQSGIVFIDEIDKIAVVGGGAGSTGPEVSRGGVQRDLLPIIEGSTVQTKIGAVKTDHVLFIAAGAFHSSKPSDLIPELQGRLPIRVELDHLTEDDFRQILTQPRNALTRQYEELLAVDGVHLRFEESGIAELARLAVDVNRNTENIGARRLHTLLERLLEEVSFDAPDRVTGEVIVDSEMVRRRLDSIAENRDLARYIL